MNLKEFKSDNEGNRIYTLEAVDITKAGSILDPDENDTQAEISYQLSKEKVRQFLEKVNDPKNNKTLIFKDNTPKVFSVGSSDEYFNNDQVKLNIKRSNKTIKK